MEIIAEDENGRHLFVIFIYEILPDPIIYAYKSNLPEYVFELRTIKPLLDKLLTPGLCYRVHKYYADHLVAKLKKVKRIERWFFKDQMLTAQGKLCRSYYFTVEDIMKNMAEPVNVPFTMQNLSHVFESLLEVIENIKKYNPFIQINRQEFETYINGHFELESAYVECYHSSTKFYMQKTELAIDGKILLYQMRYSIIQLIFLYELNKIKEVK